MAIHATAATTHISALGNRNGRIPIVPRREPPRRSLAPAFEVLLELTTAMITAGAIDCTDETRTSVQYTPTHDAMRISTAASERRGQAAGILEVQCVPPNP